MATQSLRQHQRSGTVKWIIVFALILALVGAVVGLSIVLNRQITTRTLGSTAYAIGGLNESGEEVKDTATIRTKDFVTVDGLKIEIAEKAEIQYKLFFYGENDKQEKTYISATEYLTANFDGTIPENAKFVKIVIDPLNDTEVSTLEVRGYANQLEVTYNR